jgi:4-amino-4-deoxy-L-arabinose transferase-like glycosyltransferase
VTRSRARVAPSPGAIWVVLLLALALVVRLGVVAATSDYKLRSDPADYDRHGRSIAAGNGYPESETAPAGGPTAYWPPVYPYFVGVVYAIAGDKPNTVRVAQALVGAVTVALVGLLGWRLWGGRAGMCAMALAAVFPPLVVIDTALTPEALFLPLMLGAVAAALRCGRSGAPLRWAAAAGALGGLAILTRANGALLLVPLALAVWGGPPRRSLRAALPMVLLLATAAVTVAPWTVRNAVETNAFVPVSTQDGYTLAGTYNARSDADETYPGAWRPPVAEARRILRARPGLDEVELGGELRGSATEYLRDHPPYVAEVAYWNAVRLLHLDGFSYVRADNFNLGVGQRLSDASAIALWLLLPMAAAGAALARTRRPPWLFWLAPLAMAVAPLFIVGEIRFRAAIDLFLLMLAGLALAVLVERLQASSASRGRNPSGSRPGGPK